MNASFENTNDKKMLDIGSGVGFPSVPFLIFKKNFDLFIAEPSLKRVAFLETVKKQLDLKITFMVQRIEDVTEEGMFDFITARAVTSLKNLIEISSKVGAIDAKYSFLKGPKIYDELDEAD
jgi:16S rRNA (guanine527-N7)-methyltransferase